jgi:hypothetical protein
MGARHLSLVMGLGGGGAGATSSAQATTFAIWTKRHDISTTASQRALAGPGAFPNPDFLEVRSS